MRKESSLCLLSACLAIGCFGLGSSSAAMTSPTRIPPYAPPPNLGRIRASLGMDSNSEAKLLNNGFVVLDGVTRDRLNDAYPVESPGEVFVTTDALLYLWQGLQQDVLLSAERKALLPELSQTVDELETANVRLLALAKDPASRTALQGSERLIGVAARLLLERESLVVSLRPDVARQAALVVEHRRMTAYPGEDYTAYTPRGHYAGKPDMERYFRGSLWLSRNFMAVERVRTGESTDRDSPLKQAIAIAAVLRAAPGVRKKLNTINLVRALLAGPANEISTEQLLTALDRRLGAGWSLTMALRQPALEKIRQELRRAIYPAAAVHTRPTIPGVPWPGKVIAILPDAAIPDSVLFQDTVNDAIPGRSLPTGLEVAAALGSTAGREQIEATDRHAAAVLRAVDRHPELSKDDGQSVYRGWLAVLATLQQTDPRAPEFMRTRAWDYEKLNTSLASWAQLRHNFVLYGAQSYATMGIELSPPPGLVEPIPPFYRALSLLSRREREVLDRHAALTTSSNHLLRLFEGMTGFFEKCAEAELSGTLSPAQSASIQDFGHSLIDFRFTSGPVVADVATGENGEVLHAAVGKLNPIVVIPDRKTGLAYVGWVMSYYEFVRPAGDRLTDARWQDLLSNVYLKPERPRWAAEFLGAAGGAEWDSRAPLREAERLMMVKRGAEAVGLLRRTVAANPDTPLAAEAQCRLGRYYIDSGEIGKARTELSRCLRMYGCSAVDRARRLLRYTDFVQARRSAGESSRPRTPSPAEKIHAAIDALSSRSRLNPQRPSIEHHLIDLLLDSSIRDEGESDEDSWSALAASAIKVVHDPDYREVIDYLRVARLEYGMDGQASVDTAALSEWLGISKRARSPTVHAVVLVFAIRNGLWWDDTSRACTALKPCLRDSWFAADSSRVLRILETALETGRKKDIPDSWFDPRRLFDEWYRQARTALINRAFERGDLDSVQAAAALPRPRMSSSDVAQPEAPCRELLPGNREPLRRWGIANGAWRRRDLAGAVTTLQSIADDFPDSPLAAPALSLAASLLSRDNNPATAAPDHHRAEVLRDRLLQRYPNSYSGLRVALTRAMASGPILSVRSLLPRLEFLEKTSSVSARLGSGIDLYNAQWRLEQRDKLASILEPLLRGTVARDLLQQIPLDTEVPAIAARLEAAVPDRAASIYAALIPLGYCPVRELFLRRWPDDARAAEAWGGPQGAQGSTCFPLADGLPWLVPLIERGAAYRFNAQALAVLERDVAATKHADSNEETLALVAENARLVEDRYPGTRAARGAEVVMVRTLLDLERPEDALKRLTSLAPLVPAEDSLQQEIALLDRRARLAIEAKHRPEWEPTWTRKVGAPSRQIAITMGIREVASPMEAGTRVVVPFAAGNAWIGVEALDRGTGRILWTVPVGGVCEIASVPGGPILCGTSASSFVGLAPATGKVLYERVLDLNRTWATGVLAVGDTAIAYSEAGVVAGLDAETGRLLWRKEWMPVRGTPAFDEKNVYLGTQDGVIHAIDGRTGSVVWERAEHSDHPNRPPLMGQPTLVDGGLLVNELAIELLDTESGAVLHTWVPATALPFNSRTVRGRGVALIVGDCGSRLLSLSDGAERPLQTMKGRENALLGVSHDVAYVRSEDEPEIQAYDVWTDAKMAAYRPDSNPGNLSVAIGQQSIYLLTTDGEMTALPLVNFPQSRLTLRMNVPGLADGMKGREATTSPQFPPRTSR